jgi:hypothetical protein
MKTSLALALLASGLAASPAYADRIADAMKQCNDTVASFRDMSSKAADAQNSVDTLNKDESDLMQQNMQKAQLEAKIQQDQAAYNNATGQAKNQAKAQLMADQNALLVVNDMIAILDKKTKQERAVLDAAKDIQTQATAGAATMDRSCHPNAHVNSYLGGAH